MIRLSHVLGLAAVLLALPVGNAVAQPSSGRALYLGHRPFAAGRAATANHLPPQFAACASCHGPLAAGRREGGIAAPPVTWADLARHRDGEPAYGEASEVMRAVTEGIGRGGRPLGPAMPRFRLDQAEAEALVHHLRIVGTVDDQPPGVSHTTIELGTALPLTGPAASIGRAVLLGLQGVITDLAAQGGVNGRRINLTAEDSAGGQVEAAVRRLLAKQVYAVIGGLWEGASAADLLLAEARVSHVGSLVVRDKIQTGVWVADMLPPLDVQQAALAQVVERCHEGLPRMALRIGGRQTEGAAGLDGSGVRWFTDPAALATALQAATSVGCISLGLQGMAALGQAVPPGWRRLAILPFPPAVLAFAVPGGRGVPWQGLGHAAARLTVELLARSGAVLHERSLLERLTETTGFAALPDAPVRFGPRRFYAWDPADIDLASSVPPVQNPGNLAGGSRQ